MITLGNFKAFKPENYDEVWIIVRSIKDKSFLSKYNNVFHVPELSPSMELFMCYLSWKHGDVWDKYKFDNNYLPMFLKEMTEKSATQKLNELYFKDKAGKNILLICFCEIEEMCHRSIVGGLLQGVGVPVISYDHPFFIDYSKYHKLYLEIKQNSYRQGAILWWNENIYLKGGYQRGTVKQGLVPDCTEE